MRIKPYIYFSFLRFREKEVHGKRKWRFSGHWHEGVHKPSILKRLQSRLCRFLRKLPSQMISFFVDYWKKYINKSKKCITDGISQCFKFSKKLSFSVLFIWEELWKKDLRHLSGFLLIKVKLLKFATYWKSHRKWSRFWSFWWFFWGEFPLRE